MSNRRFFSVLVCLSAAFMLGVMQLNRAYSERMDKASNDIAEGRTLVLDKSLNAQNFQRFLIDYDYFTDERDAQFAAQWIIQEIQDSIALANLGELNTRRFKMPAELVAQRGGTGYAERLRTDEALLGVTPEYVEAESSGTVPTVLDVHAQPAADAEIKVLVVEDQTPVQGVLVRLKEHYYDTLSVSGGRAEEVASERILGFAMTGADGYATFRLQSGGSYSVVPVRSGYSYGRAQGTTSGSLASGITSMRFRQKPHTITPFDVTTYQRIKRDGSLVVRTPDDWKGTMTSCALMFVAGWWVFAILLCIIDKRYGAQSDRFIPIVLMILTAIGWLAMFSIQVPLIDKMNGVNTTQGILIGLAGMLVLSLFKASFITNYHTQASSSIVGMGSWPWLERRGIARPAGWGYLLMALMLMTALYVLGTGPEGSDAKVNLFGMQPSEVSKFLVVAFFACFFTANTSLLRSFAEVNVKRQIGTVVMLLVALLVVCGMYVVALSDMGPALVLICTFVIIYSLARDDFGHLLIGVGSYLLMFWAACMANDTLILKLSVTFVWFVGWGLYCAFVRHRLYESSIFMNIFIAMFMLGGELLIACGMHEGYRLMNRINMAWTGVWSNQVEGGDQVAHGLWALASGGLSGQGIGRGHASFVPAGHTDMILESIGEMMGWGVLFVVTVCFVLILWRSVVLARRAAHPFAFYLIFGIGTVIAVQYFVISLGSIGCVPLTGVSVPFMSYGKSALIINMLAFGMVLSLSRYKATDSQKKYIHQNDSSLLQYYALVAVLALTLTGTLFAYQTWRRDDTLVRPAFVTNTNGVSIVEYNPRIAALMDCLEAGNIYDRNGLLLASSTPSDVEAAMDTYREVGLPIGRIRNDLHLHKRRYYPWGDDLLFMLGDFNTRTVWNVSDDNPVGYVAEAQHLAQLRGFQNIAIDTGGNAREYRLVSEHYKDSPYLPPYRKESMHTLRDYSYILPGLRDGEDGKWVKRHNAEREKRDLRLTIDARLQHTLQTSMAEGVNGLVRNHGRTLRRMRASVVVLNAQTGDLLCSANYPLPSQDSLRMLSHLRIYSDQPHEMLGSRAAPHAPITERDLGLTFQTQPGSTAKVISAMAGLKRYGVDAARLTYDVHGDETIEGRGRGGNWLEPVGNVTMREAIRMSSNCYFINLVHAERLYPQLDTLYRMAGLRIQDEPVRAAYDRGMNTLTPYYFVPSADGDGERRGSYTSLLLSMADDAYATYDAYRAGRQLRKMNWWQTGMAWGQGALRATPLNMARIVQIVANHGVYVPTRYVLDGDAAEGERVLDGDAADVLASYMQLESDKHRANGYALPGTAGAPGRMGGKTGTPERGDRYGGQPNDAWYVFFMPSESAGAPLAVAVRLERSMHLTSGAAVRFTAGTVIPALRRCGY